jgi:hypothetical protein
VSSRVACRESNPEGEPTGRWRKQVKGTLLIFLSELCAYAVYDIQ